MNDPIFVIDLGPYWSVFEQNYMCSPTRLIGPFDQYMVLIVDMYKAITNDTSEDEVLIDNYLNGSYVQLNTAMQETARAAVLAGLDIVITLANVGDQYPGAVKHCILDIRSRTMVVIFGGENGEA